MFNFKEFVVKNLINGVKNGSFTKEYASILATNYLLKGILSEEDIARFDGETTEEVVETPVEEEVTVGENQTVEDEEVTIEETVEETIEEPETGNKENV